MDNKQTQLGPEGDGGGFFSKNPLLLFAIFSLVSILIFKSFVAQDDSEGFGATGAVVQTKRVDYFELKELIKNGQVERVLIGETTIKGLSLKNNQATTYIADKVIPDATLVPLLDEKKVRYTAFSERNWLTDMLLGWVLPVFIFFGIWMLLTNRMQRNIGGGILGMGQMKKFINSEKPKVTFADVAGNDEAKEEVQEIVEFLREPERYIRLGAKIPKGVLLVGPPGTGKTLLAKAVAGEAGAPFFSVTGSSFIEMFVGVGASRVRDLFEGAKKEAPAIIFIDEIDAIGKSRAAGGFTGGNDEREQTLNQLLAEMDGFGSEAPVIVLAATNRPEILDPALLRPGRFDRQVLVDKPDFKGRIEILKVHIKEIKTGEDVDLEEIGRLTAGLAGADLANIINEAALLAGRASKESVNQHHLREAVERAIAGLEKRSRRISQKEKRIVAYHESGHALLAETTHGAKRVTKVSIVPRGLAALGYTLNTPEENKYLMQRHELLAEVDVLLAGRAAEELFIGEISTGAGNDLERATDILKGMVMVYGMSDVAGLMVLEKQRNSFLGGGYGQGRDYSEDMAREVDGYIKKMLDEHYILVKERLKQYAPAIETMVGELFEVEVIDGMRVKEIIRAFESDAGLESLLEEEGDDFHAAPKEEP